MQNKSEGELLIRPPTHEYNYFHIPHPPPYIYIYPVPLIIIQVDPFHTLFGLAGLSLLGSEEVKPINPVLCMPQHILDGRGLKIKLLS